MKIEHLALWTNRLEEIKEFYVRYFGAVAGPLYNNAKNKFSSYFLSFDSGPRLELMQMPAIPSNHNDVMEQYLGLIHFAVSVGSEQAVDALTETLREAGYCVIGEPRRTGDGYYESVILDPDQNRVEITV